VSCGQHQTQACDVSPFLRYQPHRFSSAIVAPGTEEGIHDVPNTSSIFAFCKKMCETGGSWNHGIICPLARFKLHAVQAVTHSSDHYTGFRDAMKRTSNLRKEGLPVLNPAVSKLTHSQLYVLDALRSHFHERPPGTDPRDANTFYSFHGCRWEFVRNMCHHGIVNARSKDPGFFGSGFYTTLNIEYAARYARGEFDPSGAERETRDGCYPVIMFACFVSVVYPVTPEVDYGTPQCTKAGHSQFYGKPLNTGCDCHVSCVHEAKHFQAVDRSACQYVEVVIDQNIQVLPVAVLWMQRI
jgi:hypothetical protein